MTAAIQEEAEDVIDVGLSPDEVVDLSRIALLKKAIDEMQKEVDYLTEVYCKRLDGVNHRVKVGDDMVVKAVRTDPRRTVKDLDGLERLDPVLFDRVTRRAVSPDGLRKAMRLGYFAPGTPEAPLLITTQVKPYLRFSNARNEES